MLVYRMVQFNPILSTYTFLSEGFWFRSEKWNPLKFTIIKTVDPIV